MLRISAITSIDTSDWVVGKKVLSVFSENDSRLIPESLFQWENRISDFESIPACEPYWAQLATMQAQGSKIEFPIGLRWKRKKVVKYDAEISHTHIDLKGERINGSLRMQAQFHKKIDWLNVFRELCLAMKPSYAFMHFFSECEVVGVKSGTPESYFSSGIVHRGTIPNLGWAVFYGDEFAEAVDAERIAAAGFPIEKIGSGYLVRITEHLQDVVSNFSLFSKRRAELKTLFPEGFFLIQHEPLI
ncbi:hypothetical protein [Pseudomonas sp. Z13]|uniref:hypothetical protein n=1 Tax=Pseudomonas sp. Z13 TaxID=2983409 RepID=UPI002E802921|nr:hypothetical protein [Pseudomonas sp. Z13]